MMSEISSGFDSHSDNQKRFGLPDRRTAKIFVFKLIYGGTDFGYSVDPMFNHLSNSKKYWTKLIDEFYKKYAGVRKWHEKIVSEVVDTGRLVMPTGREYHYPVKDVIDRMWYWKPKILNYPVQGTGADLVCIGRVTAYKRLRSGSWPVIWQSTVHDSLDIDVLDNSLEVVYNICRIIDQSIKDIPTNFYRLFGVEFNLPISAEIQFGPNLANTELYVPANHST